MKVKNHTENDFCDVIISYLHIISLCIYKWNEKRKKYITSNKHLLFFRPSQWHVTLFCWYNIATSFCQGGVLEFWQYLVAGWTTSDDILYLICHWMSGRLMHTLVSYCIVNVVNAHNLFSGVTHVLSLPSYVPFLLCSLPSGTYTSTVKGATLSLSLPYSNIGKKRMKLDVLLHWNME